MKKHFLYGWRRGNDIVIFSKENASFHSIFSCQYNGRSFNMHSRNRIVYGFGGVAMVCRNIFPIWLNRHYVIVFAIRIAYQLLFPSNLNKIKEWIENGMMQQSIGMGMTSRHWFKCVWKAVVTFCWPVRSEWNMRQTFVSEQKRGNQEKRKCFMIVYDIGNVVHMFFVLLKFATRTMELCVLMNFTCRFVKKEIWRAAGL